MPTANYDASDYLKAKTARVLYNFRKQQLAAGDRRPEQQPYSEAAILMESRMGGMARVQDSKVVIESCCSQTE
jgi:hypothetical protein